MKRTIGYFLILHVCLVLIGNADAAATQPPSTATANEDIEFLNTAYTYVLGMPLHTGCEIDATNPIVAINNKKSGTVTVSFDPTEIAQHHFVLKQVFDRLDNQKILVKIFTNNKMDFDKYSFTLLAKTEKMETPVKTIVTILANETGSILQFSRQLFTADLRHYPKDNKIPLKFAQGVVALTRGQARRDEDFTLDGISEENKKHLKLKVVEDPATKNVTVGVDLINATEEFMQQEVLNAVLKVKLGSNAAHTVLQILLPGKEDAKVTEAHDPSSSENSHEAIVPEASNGYMNATILLSLFIATTIVAYVVYSMFYKRR